MRMTHLRDLHFGITTSTRTITSPCDSTHGTFGLVRGALGLVRGALSLVLGALAMVQGASLSVNVLFAVRCVFEPYISLLGLLDKASVGWISIPSYSFRHL